ncbi:MAG: long-chain fatty acid--CoA ligase [Candidatus Eisenbacteria bacterium]|uniref:Long-chain fatty acid--CoA ligase n=1 Tax=Eiseniibacteriota bacterium TaxID=2212470 RepID=A0A948S0F1_UNCEI|nr:long-chain fatty acid--CoA ligase [Candidatus Eisenbacteria bacterium]MBU1949516.1 long-chain fatty acid--CoA ligase [Candidatus Eisenbacteria bacterium]MBU2692547.1 long-chain fatty acid--CoA ligase [Candidatus Eisenbacteria bacterium]
MPEKSWYRFYDKGVPIRPDFEELPLPSFLERAASRFPSRPATIFLNQNLTYGRLKDHVDRLATALTALGVVRDSRVAIHLPNLPQTAISVMAVLSLGAQVVMTNPLNVSRELEEQWTDAECTVVITTDFLYNRHIAQIHNNLTIRHYIVASIPDYLSFPVRPLAALKLRRRRPSLLTRMPRGPEFHSFKSLIRWSPACPPRPVIRMDDAALLQYTGGTTGRSKGAILTHGNLSYNVQQMHFWFPGLKDGGEVFLSVLPQFHIFGFTVALLLPIFAGATMVVMPNPRDIPIIIKNIKKHRVTLFPAVPAIFKAINSYSKISRKDVRSLKWSFAGGAPLPIDTLQRFEELTGGKLVEGYGLTEASPLTHANPLGGKRKAGSIGIPVPGTDAKIVDTNNGIGECAPGEEGELIVRGPQIMQGYYNNPEETAQALRNGWLHTGDLAMMDEDGFVTIVGRKKDMILASGYNIYPDEIDSILMEHPAITEACTIGVPDPKRGETVKSFVVLKPGETVTEEEIISYCKKQLAAYKVPRLIDFRETLPKSGILKFLRRVLREEELAEIQKCHREID